MNTPKGCGPATACSVFSISCCCCPTKMNTRDWHPRRRRKDGHNSDFSLVLHNSPQEYLIAALPPALYTGGGLCLSPSAITRCLSEEPPPRLFGDAQMQMSTKKSQFDVQQPHLSSTAPIWGCQLPPPVFSASVCVPGGRAAPLHPRHCSYGEQLS